MVLMRRVGRGIFTRIGPVIVHNESLPKLFKIINNKALYMQTQSLLSSLESFQKHDVFPQHAVHPFATAAPEASSLLQELINTTEQLSRSLDIYDSSVQWSNAKLTSLLRQHTSIEHASYSVS